MAAPCDPAPENAIIIVCTIYVDEENTDERIFPGAPCWYTTAPPPTTRKRARTELEQDNHTFVTTVYPADGNEPPALAGICIGQTRRDRTGLITVGVAISGAITIARPKPRDGEPEPFRPEPGYDAFFNHPEGTFGFAAPEQGSQDLRIKLIPFLRAMSMGLQFSNRTIVNIVALWLPFLGTYGEERQRMDQVDGITEFEKQLSLQFADQLADQQSASPEIRERDFIDLVVNAAEVAIQLPEDVPNDLPATLAECVEYLIPMAAAKCQRLLQLTEERDAITQQLRELRQNFGEYDPETGRRRPWARVLDTGASHSVRLLLKLV